MSWPAAKKVCGQGSRAAGNVDIAYRPRECIEWHEHQPCGPAVLSPANCGALPLQRMGRPTFICRDGGALPQRRRVSQQISPSTQQRHSCYQPESAAATPVAE